MHALCGMYTVYPKWNPNGSLPAKQDFDLELPPFHVPLSTPLSYPHPHLILIPISRTPLKPQNHRRDPGRNSHKIPTNAHSRSHPLRRYTRHSMMPSDRNTPIVTRLRARGANVRLAGERDAVLGAGVADNGEDPFGYESAKDQYNDPWERRGRCRGATVRGERRGRKERKGRTGGGRWMEEGDG